MPETPERKASAGPVGASSDLLEFLKFIDSERLEQFKEAAEAEKFTKDDLVAVVPDSVLRMASALAFPLTYKLISSQVPDDVHHLIEKAKELAIQHFGPVLWHPVVTERCYEIWGYGAEAEEDTLLEAEDVNLNVISGMTVLPTWLGDPPDLIPAFRIGFTGQDDQLLLDSLLRWSEILFVASGLVGILGQGMGNGRQLAEFQQLDLAEMAEIAEYIGSIEKGLTKVKSLAPIYGIELESPKSGEEDQS